MQLHWHERVGGKWEIPEKTHLPAALSGTIPTCENPGATHRQLNLVHLNFCIWELCLIMPLAGGFSLGSLVSPHPIHSSAAPYSPCITLFGSQDVNVKSCPNLLTHSLASHEGKPEFPYLATRAQHRPVGVHPQFLIGMRFWWCVNYLCMLFKWQPSPSNSQRNPGPQETPAPSKMPEPLKTQEPGPVTSQSPQELSSDMKLAVASRKQDDLISAFFTFFLKKRDKKKIALQLRSTKQKLDTAELHYIPASLTIQRSAAAMSSIHLVAPEPDIWEDISLLDLRLTTRKEAFAPYTHYHFGSEPRVPSEQQCRLVRYLHICPSSIEVVQGGELRGQLLPLNLVTYSATHCHLPSAAPLRVIELTRPLQLVRPHLPVPPSSLFQSPQKITKASHLLVVHLRLRRPVLLGIACPYIQPATSSSPPPEQTNPASCITAAPGQGSSSSQQSPSQYLPLVKPTADSRVPLKPTVCRAVMTTPDFVPSRSATRPTLYHSRVTTRQQIIQTPHLAGFQATRKLKIVNGLYQKYQNPLRKRAMVGVAALASHQGKPSLIPGRITLGYVGIVLDDPAGQQLVVVLGLQAIADTNTVSVDSEQLLHYTFVLCQLNTSQDLPSISLTLQGLQGSCTPGLAWPITDYSVEGRCEERQVPGNPTG
ncbi:hypothetical protein PR048_026214 [Dryococelus australis]|uniref:Uncharacterized protein n=1 Tax=Dryococelus australis TaxID=614101 RepID=A0ABQ9GKR0_9NEOP|nr:hypothetical protein PR048_026214 [Dryococelus australis]